MIREGQCHSSRIAALGRCLAFSCEGNRADRPVRVRGHKQNGPQAGTNSPRPPEFPVPKHEETV